jgi:hypothetical protein
MAMTLRMSPPVPAMPPRLWRMPACCALALVLLLSLAARDAAAQSFDFERTLPHTGTVTLDVRTERGAIEVTSGEAGRVVVTGTATVRLGFNVPVNAVELAKRIAEQPPITTEGDTVKLRPPASDDERRAATVAYRVRVPPGTAVITESDSGATTIDSVDGRVQARTQSSSLTLSRIGGDARVDTGSGAVSIERVKGALDVTTQSSGITVRELSGNLTARTGSGRIEVSFDGPGNANIQTQSSAITVTRLNGGIVARSNSGEIRVAGRAGGDWRLSTGSSRILLELDTTSRDFDVDLSTHSGRIELEHVAVASAGGGASAAIVEQRRVRGTVGAGGPRIEATSRSGSISLRQ